MLNVDGLFGLLLVFARVGCFFTIIPVFSVKQIPNQVKVLLVAILSLSLSYWVETPQVVSLKTMSLILMFLQEMVLGLMLGYVVQLVFLALQSAGDYIDFFAGLKMSTSYDPITGTNTTIYSNFYNWLGVLLFFQLNGHHVLMTGLVRSYEWFAISVEPVFTLELGTIVYLVTRFFTLSLQLAVPLCLVLFLIDVILGLFSRMVPQINIFILGMPVKIIVSFILFGLLGPVIIQSLVAGMESVVSILDEFVRQIHQR